MLLQAEHFDKFADYFQFSVEDENANIDPSAEIWTRSAMDDMIAALPRALYIMTARNMTVPIDIEVHDSEPLESLEDWDHVVDASIDLPSASLVVFSMDYFPDAARMKLAAGCYRARVFYGKLNSLRDDGLSGDDHYKIILWPGAFVEAGVIKRKVSVGVR